MTVNTIIYITDKVFNDIVTTIGSKNPETGGIIGCDAQGVICAFHYDSFGVTESHCYTPDEHHLNKIVGTVWYPKNISYIGFVHSHHPMYPKLSKADYDYAHMILAENIHMDKILMGVVIPNSKIEKVRINFESISQDSTVKPVTLVII